MLHQVLIVKMGEEFPCASTTGKGETVLKYAQRILGRKGPPLQEEHFTPLPDQGKGQFQLRMLSLSYVSREEKIRLRNASGCHSSETQALMQPET